jgi:hypothetical protein
MKTVCAACGREVRSKNRRIEKHTRPSWANQEDSRGEPCSWSGKHLESNKEAQNHWINSRQKKWAKP